MIQTLQINDLERNRRLRAEEDRSNLLSRVAELERRLQESQREAEQWRCDYERTTNENQSLQNLIENLQSSLSVSTGLNHFPRKNILPTEKKKYLLFLFSNFYYIYIFHTVLKLFFSVSKREAGKKCGRIWRRRLNPFLLVAHSLTST